MSLGKHENWESVEIQGIEGDAELPWERGYDAGEAEVVWMDGEGVVRDGCLLRSTTGI